MSIVGVIALALFSALFARLWYLQVAATSEYAAAAQSNSVRTVNEPPIRGRILDAKGRVLVDNRIANVITIDRKLSPARRTMVVNRLAELLKTPAADPAQEARRSARVARTPRYRSRSTSPTKTPRT